MASSQDQLLLVFGLLYGCGALVELLIRIFQGTPWQIPQFFYQHYVSAFLQPVVFCLLPALLWPLIILYTVLRPAIEVFQECCGSKDDFSASDDDIDTSSASPESRQSIAGDVEKGHLDATSERRAIST